LHGGAAGFFKLAGKLIRDLQSSAMKSQDWPTVCADPLTTKERNSRTSELKTRLSKLGPLNDLPAHRRLPTLENKRAGPSRNKLFK
jgi:hypothetical protein